MPEQSATKKKWTCGPQCGFHTLSLNAGKLQTIECSNPLKNYSMKCGFCDEFVWRFDMEKHVNQKHPGQDCPAEGIVSDAEKEILKKKKRIKKNNLIISDLRKLSDDALKILPLKDFWDFKKKDWKDIQYGTFGKQISPRMKRIFGQERFQ